MQLETEQVRALIRPSQRAGFLLACAYPDRIARRRHSGGFQLANGRSAGFPGNPLLGQQPWLVVAEVGGIGSGRNETIRSAASLDDSLFETALADLVREQSVVEWDKKSGRFVAERQARIGALVLRSHALDAVPVEARWAALIGLLRADGLGLLTWKAEHRQWRGRVNLLHALDSAGKWPDVGDDALLDRLETWLGPWLDRVDSLQGLKKLEMTKILAAMLDWEQQQKLEQLAPQRLQVPSGSSVRIDYSQDPPVLAVKLQEMFGCEQTPTVADGKVELIVHLLSPAGRPLQVTRDLAGFWRSSYHDVKKEMKGRYPKHPWPDDPLSALPTRKTRHSR